MFEYRIATRKDLESIWDMNIADNPGDARWKQWKQKYIGYNLDGKALTFVVVANGSPIGEGTLLLHPECDAVNGVIELSDGKTVANINALRIRKEFEGQGHVSKLVKLMEEYSINHGIKILTIGVEAKETRNLSIYLHWGFSDLIFYKFEDSELVLYYSKNLELRSQCK